MEKNEKINRGLWFFIDLILMVVLFVSDRLTKQAAIVHLKDRPAIVLLDGILELNYLENKGSAFGMFMNQKVFLLLVGVAFMAVLLWLIWKLPAQRKYRIFHVLFSVVIAGGIGNLVDRFLYGYVVDFISFVLIHFPIFNVADICIVVAMIGIFLLFVFVYKEEDFTFLIFEKKHVEKDSKSGIKE